MANYTTKLKTWGAQGQEYPDNYNYVEGEAPVDAWDNFSKYNLIKDLQNHVIPLTNSRIESDKGVAGGEPTNPESSHLYYDTDNEVLKKWNVTNSAWEVIFDETDFPLDNSDLTNSSVTVTAGNQLTGGGNVALGGTVTVGINEGAGSGLDADTVDGENASAFADSGHLHDSRYILESGDSMGGILDLSGNDLEDGTNTIWDASAGYINQSILQNDDLIIAGNTVSLGGSTAVAHGDLSDAPASAHHTRYADSEAVSAVNAQTSLSVDISGDADTVDGFEASDLGVDVEEGGTTIVSNSTGINFSSHLNVVDDTDGTVTIDPTHNHDSRYINSSGDSMEGALDLSGNDLLDGTTTIWDSTNGQIPQSSLENKSVSIAGNTVSLGGSTAVSHSDLSTAPSNAHHSRYSDSEAVSAINSSNIYPSTVTANGGVEVAGSNFHSYAGVRADNNANSGHLMLDSNGGHLYLNWEDGGHIRMRGQTQFNDRTDFNQNESKRFRINNRSSDPSAANGQMWYRYDLD